jgi:hypothetical protein
LLCLSAQSILRRNLFGIPEPSRQLVAESLS